VKCTEKKVDTRDELLVNVLNVIACTKERQDPLRRTTRHVLTRVAKCTDVDGGIFEHFYITSTNSVTGTINTGIRNSTYS
jgi:hypothetical protein